MDAVDIESVVTLAPGRDSTERESERERERERESNIYSNRHFVERSQRPSSESVESFHT
jgi:hypothetical protein